MTYIDGFVTAVPTANRDAYLAHAERAAAMVREFGVARFFEGWGDDVPHGTRNDLHRAVQASDDETIVFSWFEYPDRATRDAASARMMDDPRMAAMVEDMPFDGKRMIYGGFASVHEHGAAGGTGYVDGVVMPVPAGARNDYARFAAETASIFTDHGALRTLDAVGDDVPAGEATDFHRAILREGDEMVGFGWVEWPDKATRDAGWEAIMADPRMQRRDPPFDGKRMMFGGFVPLLDQGA